jgi:predicted nuclease with TOPRIM domain
MEAKLCEEKHKRLDEKIEVHDRRLNNHGERIDRIELSTGRLEERLKGLIDQLGSLTTTLKWFIGLIVGSFVAFFFYAIQNGLFS